MRARWLWTAAGRLARRGDLPSRVAFGAINGLLPCGLVYATLSLPVAAADPAVGAAIMATFGLLTVPALVLSLGLRRAVGRSLFARRILAAAVLVAGLGALSVRAGLGAAAGPGEGAPCHASPDP